MPIPGFERIYALPLTANQADQDMKVPAAIAAMVYRKRIGAIIAAESIVAEYDRHMERVTSVHMSVNELVDWSAISIVADPPEPDPDHSKSKRAQQELDSYVPSLGDFLLFRSGNIRKNLESSLSRLKQLDRQANESRSKQWSDTCAHQTAMRALAKAVLAGEEKAWGYVIRHIDPMYSLAGIAESAHVHWQNPSIVEITLRLTSEDVVPETTLTFTKRGQVSEKAMAQRKRWEMYEDVICGAAIRAAREMFHALPFKAITVHCTTTGINRETGLDEEVTVLSIHYPRREFLSLGFERLDPSDSLKRFNHNKDFKRGEGFRPVPRVVISNDLRSI